jgi:hypothetical protein
MGCISILLRTRYIIIVYALVLLAVAAAVKKFKMVRLEPERPKHTGPPPAGD